MQAAVIYAKLKPDQSKAIEGEGLATIINIGIYSMDIDVEKTARFYDRRRGPSCDCAGCRNFNRAVHILPEPVQEFFRRFGVDPANPAEMSAYVSRDGNATYYNGFYHVCGKILEGRQPMVKVAEKRYELDERYVIHLDKETSAYFTEEVYLLDKNFPEPAIQLEFDCTLPWLLDEKNPYTFE